MSNSLRPLALGLLAAALSACVAPSLDEGPAGDPGDTEGQTSSLSASQRKARATLIRDVAAEHGINNAVLLAGIANAETQLSHCWSELTWACKGPVSADCGGGPVVAGAGDGPCSLKQGGLGMYQFDAGTFSDTLARDGTAVLTLKGNVERAIDFVVDMIRDSAYVGGVTTDLQAKAWINGVVVGGAGYDAWITSVTHYYNGCVKGGCSIFWDRYDHYDSHTQDLVDELGASFWSASPLAAGELAWARQADGSYRFSARPGAGVTKVDYFVDGYRLGGASADDPKTAALETDFPLGYVFKSATSERFVELFGYDAAGEPLSRAIGLLDVTAGTGVFVRQVSEATYEVGLERAAVEVAGLELRVDGHLVKDGISGATRTTRGAVLASYSTLGTRELELSTFNANGTLRGKLRRSFTLE
jgi:hypothetical protein